MIPEQYSNKKKIICY